MENKFKIENSKFEKKVFYEEKDKLVEICTIIPLNNTLEVRIREMPKNVDSAVFLDINFLKNRDTEIQTNFISGTEDYLNFNNVYNFGELKSGKTPSKIKQLFEDEANHYPEVFTKAKILDDKNVYFCIRELEEYSDDEDEANNEQINKPRKQTVFLIGLYLYDPKSKNHEVYEPLQTIYSTKVKLNDLKK